RHRLASRLRRRPQVHDVRTHRRDPGRPARWHPQQHSDAMTVVTLLTKPDCRLCEHAKAVLAKVGADHPLRVHEIALDSAEGTLLATTAGVLFASGILLDGRP